MLCDNLGEWDGVWSGVEGEVKKERDMCIPMNVLVDVWQKPTQKYKAIILQLKINKF